jgi:glycyl-tRNA synthetase alpha chain
VLFDGLEITQFTYFQQAGGQELTPISAELTYGLERLAMVLQKVDNVYDLEWAPGVSYRDVRLRDEIEQSKFAFGEVPGLAPGVFAAFHRDLFDKHFEFSKTLVEAGLVIPALEQCLKCSHVFNVLDASGGVGVTERTAYILRIRQLAVKIARAQVDATTPAAEEQGA